MQENAGTVDPERREARGRTMRASIVDSSGRGGVGSFCSLIWLV